MHLRRAWMWMVGLLLAGGLRGYAGEPSGGPEAAIARIEKLGGSVYRKDDRLEVFLATDYHGLRVVDIANPKAPREVSSLEGMGHAKRVAVAGKQAYVADEEDGMWIVDVSDPKAPRKLARYGEGAVLDVAVAGKYAFLARHSLEVVDVSNPERPTRFELHDRTDEFSASRIAISGEYVYVSGETGPALSIFRLPPHVVEGPTSKKE